jgi:glucose-6-phosphate-specific signal transduction histidine kinase
MIVLALLRFSLPLIWFACGGSILCYMFLLGYAKWFADRGIVPRYQQEIFLLALVLSGIILGQVVRRVRKMAAEYAERVAARNDLTSNKSPCP